MTPPYGRKTSLTLAGHHCTTGKPKEGDKSCLIHKRRTRIGQFRSDSCRNTQTSERKPGNHFVKH